MKAPSNPQQRQRMLQRRRRQGFFLGLGILVVTSATAAAAGERSDRPPDNKLWREKYIATGQRRGPGTKESWSWKSRWNAQCTHRQRNAPPNIATMTGGSQPNSPLTSSFESGPDTFPPPQPLLDRWLPYRKRRRGTITIDLGEPDIDETDRTEGVEESIKIATMTSQDSTMTNVTRFDGNVTILEPMETNPHHHHHHNNNNNKALSIFSKLPRSIILLSTESPKPVPKHKNVELTIDITPGSLLRLTQALLQGSAGFLGAFGATLRLLAPMILARRIISTVGYVCYDYYNGRYIRTTYNKHSQLVQEYEIPSALRACGRMGLQLLSMVLVGTILRMILNSAPCFLPHLACRYWYGSIWVAAVLLASQSTSYWIKKYPALRLEKVTSSNIGSTPATFLTQPWHILQWLKDPETWLLNLTKLQRHTTTNPHHQNRRRDSKFRPDPLLFPSTWPPLYILSALAMIHAIAQTLPIKTGANTRILMQDYCLAITVLDEWKRVFLLEHRITLGLVWSAITFASFFVLACSAALEAGWIASALLLPEVFACLVSGWMNTVLYSERYVQRL